MTINKDITNIIYLINSVYDRARVSQIICYDSACNVMYSSEYIWLIGKNEFKNKKLI